MLHRITDLGHAQIDKVNVTHKFIPLLGVQVGVQYTAKCYITSK